MEYRFHGPIATMMNQPRVQGQPNPMADLFLRMNYDLALSAQYTTETAVKALLRLPEFSARYPYSYVYIDKPNEGETHAIYLIQGTRLPPDGIRYLEDETRINMNSGQVELEVLESKSGYVPGVDSVAWRVRRLFRLSKGGHGSMAMLHYSRGNPIQIPPHLLNQPVRVYPLREVNEPAVYVAGERAGQKIYPGQTQAQQQIASIASHNANLARMEQRRDRDKRESLPPPQYATDDDEDSYATNRSLALMRFTRNHDNLAEIFSPVSISQIPQVPSPYTDITKSDLEVELGKLETEIDSLRRKKTETGARLVAVRGDAEVAPVECPPVIMDVS